MDNCLLRDCCLAAADQLAAIQAVDQCAASQPDRAELIRQAVQQGRCYVAMVGEQTAAFAIISYHFFAHGLVELLLVKPEFRRQGLGGMLLRALLAECRTPKLFASTNSSNRPMQALLATCGFQRCGCVDQLDEGDPELIYYRLSRLSDQSVTSAQPLPPELNIVPLTLDRISDVDLANQPFPVIGRAVPSFIAGEWSLQEELWEQAAEKEYPSDQLDYCQYVDHPDRQVFLAYIDGTCAGHIRLRRNWNGYAFIEDIAVARDFRRSGIGSRLVGQAEAWSRAGGMRGLMLETQDVNLVACRFYQRCGFRLGGVDSRLYANSPYSDELALFWYRP